MNTGGPPADDWGSRGRRFKSCQPDREIAGQGPFWSDPERPLLCVSGWLTTISTSIGVAVALLNASTWSGIQSVAGAEAAADGRRREPPEESLPPAELGVRSAALV